MQWLLGQNSYLSLENKLIVYKTILKRSRFESKIERTPGLLLKYSVLPIWDELYVIEPYHPDKTRRFACSPIGRIHENKSSEDMLSFS